MSHYRPWMLATSSNSPQQPTTSSQIVDVVEIPPNVAGPEMLGEPPKKKACIEAPELARLPNFRQSSFLQYVPIRLL